MQPFSQTGRNMVATINYTRNTALFSQVIKSTAAGSQANTASADGLSANNADTVTLSPEAQALLAAQSGGGSTSSAVATSAAGSTTTNSAASETTKIDFTNMTPNQASSLMMSGEIPEMIPPLLMGGVWTKPSQAQIDAFNNTPFNFIQDRITKIAVGKSYGYDTSVWQKDLDEMTALQGKTVKNTVLQPDPAASVSTDATKTT
jgi:hypothetical protein